MLYTSLKRNSLQFRAYFLVLVVVLFANVAYGQNPPRPANSNSYLYRVDTRGPDIIFRDGFLPRGRSDNLVSHFLDDNWRQGNGTRFISTTDDYDTAVRFARDVHEEHLTATNLPPLDDGESDDGANDNVLYIYHIRPSREFYNMVHSMDTYVNNLRAYATPNDPSYIDHQITQVETGLERFAWEREWIWTGERGIPSSQIEYVEEAYYIDDDNNITHPRMFINIPPELRSTNSRYVDGEHEWSVEPFPIEISDRGVEVEPLASIEVRNSSDNGQYMNTSMFPCGDNDAEAVRATCSQIVDIVSSVGSPP